MDHHPSYQFPYPKHVHSSSVTMSAVAPHATQESNTSCSALGSVKITPPFSSTQLESIDDIEFSRLSNHNSPDVNMGGVELIPLDHGNTCNDNLSFLDQISVPMNMMSPPNNLFSSPNLLSGSN